MQKFENFDGLVAAIDRSNIDTDAIIPKQYLKSIKRSGFGVNLFDDWRYLDPGEPGQDHSQRRLNPDFVLNREPFRQGAYQSQHRIVDRIRYALSDQPSFRIQSLCVLRQNFESGRPALPLLLSVTTLKRIRGDE